MSRCASAFGLIGQVCLAAPLLAGCQVSIDTSSSETSPAPSSTSATEPSAGVLATTTDDDDDELALLPVELEAGEAPPKALTSPGMGPEMDVGGRCRYRI